MSNFELRRRPLWIRVWNGYRVFRAIGMGHLEALRFSWGVHK